MLLVIHIAGLKYLQGIKKFGAFTVKPETGDDIASGSLFAKKKTEPAEKPAPTGKNGHINFSWEI